MIKPSKYRTTTRERGLRDKIRMSIARDYLDRRAMARAEAKDYYERRRR